MHVKFQLVICDEDGHEETGTDIVTLRKDAQRIEHLGVTLREAKQLLNIIQQRLLQHQVVFQKWRSIAIDVTLGLR